ncbi:MAG: hypothetical protein RLY31_2052 [Bacteroidota bacterium]
MTNEIFKDLVVIEWASVLAGPAVGMFFAEQGAKVVKVENSRTGGDVTRHWKMTQEPESDPASAYYHAVNWGKEVLFLDLESEADRKRFLALIPSADIVICNVKELTARRFGLDAATLRKAFPRLVYAQLTAYGPDDQRPGFDAAIQAETGWISMNGTPEGPPAKLPVALMDLLAAHQLREGILAALYRRERTGIGGVVHVSLFDAGVAALANQASNWLNLGMLPRPMGTLHPNIAPYGEIFISVDGHPLLLASGTQRHFTALCEVLGLSDLPGDERFRTNARRLANRTILRELLQTGFSHRTAEDLLESCRQQDIPLVPVRNLRQLFELPAADRLVLRQQEPDGKLSARVRTVVYRLEDG